MGDHQKLKKVLSTIDEIQVIFEEDDIVFFLLKEREYGIWYPEEENEFIKPCILVKNYENYDYPHILSLEIPLDKDNNKYRIICLHESGDTVNYLMSSEEKILDSINRLIQLLSLSTLEIEEEFQKEFLYYWNGQAKNDLSLRTYQDSNRIFQEMNVYKDKDNNYRAVTKGIKLNDKNSWNFEHTICAFFIPIIDNRRILPPVYDKPWDINDILKIIQGKDFARISHETYESIKKVKVKSDKAFIIFEIMVLNQRINFCALIHFKNSSTDTIINKIYTIHKIETISMQRCDYYFLNQLIGNDVSIIKNKVALIGAGSLGSYIATELVKSGVKDLTLYDDDKIEEANIMRHRAKLFWSNTRKVNAMKYDLESMHPEININAQAISLTEEILERDMNEYDMIIFTVGKSDIQLMANATFKKNNYYKPVIYVWLEAGGLYSHILKVNYSQKGCFECLYTNSEGVLINNKANKAPDELVEQCTIRNGCGGTRVAYGTEILLRTTSAILDTIKKTIKGELVDNCLIDIEPTYVTNQGCAFKEGKCHCCGD